MKKKTSESENEQWTINNERHFPGEFRKFTYEKISSMIKEDLKWKKKNRQDKNISKKEKCRKK